MIKHLLKIIWTERRINVWILLELALVFCVLWFCTDYLYFSVKRYMEPKGFDIEHTYRIGISMKDEGRKIVASGSDTEKEEMLQDIWTIYDRIKKHPAIENAGYSKASIPYTGSSRYRGLFVDSTEMNSWMKVISPGFFDVFKISILSGTPFNDENSVTGNPALISGNRKDKFGRKNMNEVKEIRYPDDTKSNIIGVANKVKRDEYGDYNPVIYYPLKKDDQWTIAGNLEISVRVKPEADKNFAEQFTKDMRNQLEVGSYFLTSVTSFEKDRENYLNSMGLSGNFKSIFAISTFLFINIFLAVVGTFWLRTQSRRGEIGLRVAMGASQKSIQKMFIGETILLLLLASIVAAVICINVTMVDVLKDIGVPVIDRSEAPGMSQYLINYGITFLFLALIAVIAVWYPAQKASKIQPAEALHDE